MKKFLFLLSFIFVCEEVLEHSLTQYGVLRCENDEVVCYIGEGHGAHPYCKFKEDKK